jgi:hypothetical protein
MNAKDYWFQRFGEYPQNDSDKLAVAMMAEFGIVMWNAAIIEAAEKAKVITQQTWKDENTTMSTLTFEYIVNKESILKLIKK